MASDENSNAHKRGLFIITQNETYKFVGKNKFGDFIRKMHHIIVGESYDEKVVYLIAKELKILVCDKLKNLINTIRNGRSSCIHHVYSWETI